MSYLIKNKIWHLVNNTENLINYETIMIALNYTF